ncbi:MAG: LamG-like jellyroll fold domain-containing protein [Myxococcota bacterium]|nr:LamG-like jellyroll fold domain-containing protein [Myxococcota bacterium]
MFLLALFAGAAHASGNQAAFGGDADRIDLGTGLNPGTSFTWEAWASFETYAESNYDTILEVVDPSTAQNVFYVGYVSGNWQIEFNDVNASEGGSCTDGTEAICDATSYADYDLTHLAVVVDGTDVTLYVDGVATDTLTLSGAVTWSSTDEWGLGTDMDTAGSYSSDYLVGALDEVRIWERAHDADTVSCLMDYALTGGEPGIYALWNMDDATGSTTATDSGPNGLTGTLEEDTDFEASGFGLTVSSGGDIPCYDFDEDGLTPNDGDCDDTDATVYPGATEIDANGIDEDCDGYDGGVDSDGDGLDDDDEANTYGTDPDAPDTDGDGLSDGDEVNTYGTDPLNEDTDGEGLTDGEEVNTHGTDPLDKNSDDDGLNDWREVNVEGTDPNDADSDDDGLSDGDEVKTHGTDPNAADTDGDGLDDGEEVNTYGTDPLDTDTDDGGVADGTEVLRDGTDPLDGSDDLPGSGDRDGDGLSDDEERALGTDLDNPDSDGDGLSDGEEVNSHGTDPLNADTDGGGKSDGDEVSDGSDPLDPSDDADPQDTGDTGEPQDTGDTGEPQDTGDSGDTGQPQDSDPQDSGTTQDTSPLSGVDGLYSGGSGATCSSTQAPAGAFGGVLALLAGVMLLRRRD